MPAMARRGWVLAQTGPQEWHRLSVFDDGWLELPGFARTLSDTRAIHRKRLSAALLILGILGLMFAYAHFLGTLADPPAVLEIALPVVLGLGLVASLMYVTVWQFRADMRNRDQLDGDLEQARAFKASGRQIRRVPELRSSGVPRPPRSLPAGWMVKATSARAMWSTCPPYGRANCASSGCSCPTGGSGSTDPRTASSPSYSGVSRRA